MVSGVGSVSLVCWAAALAVAASVHAAKLSEELRGSRPNFLLVFMDDTGWGDIGANWPKTKETVHIDALAAGGIRFSDFHAGASLCTPSRAALLTGRYGLRTGVVINFRNDAAHGMPVGELTIADLLQSAGYRTKIIGKWHLGQSKPYHPTFRGFEEYFGLPYSNDMGCIQVPCANLPPQQKCIKSSGDPEWDPVPEPEFSIEYGRPRDEAQDLLGVPLYECETNCSGLDDCSKCIIEQPVDLTTLCDRYASVGADFIKKSVAKGDPFFLNTSARHSVFGDTLVEADDTIGRLIEAVEDSGVANNTLIVITADNGPWNVKCDLAGSQGPFLGEWQKQHGGGGATGKISTILTKGGHREPGIFSWPGHIERGRTSAALTSTLDLLPTFMSLAGVPLPSDRTYDGIDLGPILFDGGDTGHGVLFHPDEPDGRLTAMRLGKYKAFYETYSVAPCRHAEDFVPSNPHKHYPPLVFNLDEDPAESNPVEVSQDLLDALDKARESMLQNINNTLHFVANYTEDWSKRGCCNHSNVACCCHPHCL